MHLPNGLSQRVHGSCHLRNVDFESHVFCGSEAPLQNTQVHKMNRIDTGQFSSFTYFVTADHVQDCININDRQFIRRFWRIFIASCRPSLILMPKCICRDTRTPRIAVRSRSSTVPHTQRCIFDYVLCTFFYAIRNAKTYGN